MSAPYSDVASKLEQAAVAFATSSLPDGTNIATGQSNSDKKLPLVICAADLDNAEEEPAFTGNWWVDFAVIVKTSAPVDTDGTDTKTADDTLAKTVFDKFSVSDLQTQLSAAISDFTCFAMIPRGPQFEVDGDCFVNSLHFRAYVAPSTL